jgi:hypothetical protein
MKPVTVSVEVAQRPEDVYDFLDVLGNHKRFTDHFLVDWRLDGPARGVWARARMLVKDPRFTEDRLDMEVVAAERPRSTTEESVSVDGRRLTRGTYLLEELPGKGTRIDFRFEWLKALLIERLAAPLTRAVIRRANARSIAAPTRRDAGHQWHRTRGRRDPSKPRQRGAIMNTTFPAKRIQVGEVAMKPMAAMFRLCIAAQVEPGHYEPGQLAPAA